MSVKTSSLAAVSLVAVLSMAGCASYGPGSVKPGATRAEAEKDMGPSTARYPLEGGGERLEFRRGPQGLHTYMLDFDAQGRLAKAEQVLNNSRFSTIQPGLGRDELLKQIGHPSEVSMIGWQKRQLWSYRFDSLECQWFQVGLDMQNTVVDAGYGPDPRCEHGGDDRE